MRARLSRLFRSLRRPLRKQERGVALIMVLILVAILSSALLDFSYETRAELVAAKNLRDQVQAEYLARSALEIERLLVAGWSQGVSQQFGVGLDQLVPILETVLNTGDLSSFMGGAASAFNATGLGNLPGGGAMLLPPPREENSKININLAARDTAGRQRVFTILRDTLSDDRYLDLFEKDARLVPDTAGEFAGSVLDWTDRDTTLFGATGPENDPYGLLPDPYAKKDAPFYSLDELHLVWGVGDDLFYAIADGLTIYGTSGGGVDLVSGSPLFIRSALCSCLATPADAAQICGTEPAPIDIFLQSILPFRSAFPLRGVRNWRSFTQIAGLLDGLGASLGPLAGAFLPQIPDIPWAPNCPGVTFGVPATIYTIRGEGQVGDVRVKIRAVVDLAQDRQSGGRLLYWRME